MTKYVQQEDRAMMFDTEMRAQLAVLLGGRAAEQYCCGHISTGASDDIQRATNIAQKVIPSLKCNVMGSPWHLMGPFQAVMARLHLSFCGL